MNERKRNEQAKNKRDYYFPVILSQLICCAILVLLFFFVRGGEGWQQLRESYSSLLKEDFLTAEFSSVVSGMKEYLLEGSSSYAVFGNRVEPYNEKDLQEQTATGETQEPSSDIAPATEAQKVTEPSSLNGTPLSYESNKLNTVPLKLSYKKEQKMISPLYEGRYTSYFGERTDPIAEGSDFHKGIDIGADEGDRIRAVFDGKVISVGEDGRSGKYIFLEHEKGVVTFYCHCSKILADKGDKVKQGETIALVGSTGYSTGPHLHFEVRINDVSVDPLPLIENAD